MLRAPAVLAIVTCASMATAQSNVSIYVQEILDSLTEELLATPNMDIRLSSFESQRDKKIQFFRAYFVGLEYIRLEGQCTTDESAEVVECLAKFPYTTVMAYGNLEGAARPLIQFMGRLEDAIYLLELRSGTSLSKFHAATDPFVDFMFKRNPFQGNWEKDIRPKLTEWIRSNFVRLVDQYVKPKLSELAAQFKMPQA